MSATTLMATSSSDVSRGQITCPTCDFTASVPNGSRRTMCPKCGGFYNREDAERPEPRRLQRRGKEKEKESTERGGIQSVVKFFHNLTPNNTKKRKEFSNNLTASTSDVSGGQNTELPPIDSKGRLTASVSNSRSTTPSYAQDSSRSVSRATDKSSVNRNGHKTTLNVGGVGAGASSSSSSKLLSDRVVYPVRTKTSQQLREDIQQARETGDWTGVKEFYATTFDSFLEINAAFKRNPEKEYKSTDDPGLKFEFVNTVYDMLLGLPQEIQKLVLKSIINSLLKDKRNHDSRMNWPHSKDDLRAYLVLIQNPQFGTSSTYVIFAHLLRQIAALTDHDHHYLVYWINKLSADRFQTVLQRLNAFVSVRLFPPKPQDLPAMSKCSWWIPSCTKVMALLNAANYLNQPAILSHMEFYNPTLDNLDLMQEYVAWQDPSAGGGVIKVLTLKSQGLPLHSFRPNRFTYDERSPSRLTVFKWFSFCQYPFIISISGKRTILQRDSEQQMIIMARRSLVAKVQRRQLPDVGMLFFNLTVRRDRLVSDSLNEISKKQHDLKKKLKVTFLGEPGLDMGGLTKEWFLLLIKKIFHPNYGMFTYDKVAGVYWFSTMPREDYQEFHLVGVLMGLAVYNSIILDLRFPACCYRKLLSPPVVPFNNPNATVGVAQLTVDDLKIVFPDISKGLKDLLEYDGDVENDFCLAFEVSTEQYGQVKTCELKPGGASIPVTQENKKEYVSLYVDYLLNKSVYQQFKAFYHGFHTVCASNALIMLRPEEIDMLVCGNPKLDMKELKKVTQYDGYKSGDPTIRYFWDVVLSLPSSTQKQVLLFTTGSDRVPIGGMIEMSFKISRTEDVDLLPMSHTCFNQLVLPAYRSKKQLRHKLILALQNAEGFGLE